MNKLNVVHYYWKFDPFNLGGVEAHIASLVSSLNSKVDYSIISTRLEKQPAKISFNSAKVFYASPIKKEGSNYAESILDVFKNEELREKNKQSILDSLDFDLIHLHGPVNYSNSVLGGPLFSESYNKQAWLSAKAPKVMTFHGLPSAVLKEKYKYPLSGIYFDLWKKIEEKNIKDCDKIICVDQYVTDDVASRNLSDSLTQKLEFIPNGIDLSLFCPVNKNKARKIITDKLGLSFGDSLTLLYSNRLSKEKGILDVLKLSKSKLDFVIIIAGSGPFESAVREVCKRDGRFKFIGPAENRIIPLLMNSSDYVLTPLHHPGATRTNIEAIATNTPVITTDVHNRYPVKNGVNGVVYGSSKTLENIIESIIKTEPKYKASSFNSKKDFDLGRISKKIFNVYKELL